MPSQVSSTRNSPVILTADNSFASTMVLPVYGTDAHETTQDQAAANLAIYGVETVAEVISKFRPAGLLLVERIPFHVGFEEVQLGMLDTSERLRSFVEGAQEVARVEQMDPLLIVADQEGGAGSRLPSVALPAPALIGAVEDSELATSMAEQAGRLTSEAARAHGVGVVLGPLADLGLGNAAIGDRAFSSDPNEVARLAAAWVSGVQSSGVQSSGVQGSGVEGNSVVGVVKHWPGHGRAGSDSHVSTPVLNVAAELWAREELTPFAATIDAEVAGVLLAHLRAPSLDSSGALASQSPVLMKKLRDELSFEGFTMTDALWMPSARTSAATDAEVAVASLHAGIDLLLAPPDPEGSAELAEADPELMQRVASSVTRIARLRSQHPPVDRTIDLDGLNAEIHHFNANLG